VRQMINILYSVTNLHDGGRAIDWSLRVPPLLGNVLLLVRVQVVAKNLGKKTQLVPI
jgi:hypothetical protein